MKKKDAKKLYPGLPVYTNWANVPDNLKTKTQLKKMGKWDKDLKLGGVFASRVRRDALYNLYRIDT